MELKTKLVNRDMEVENLKRKMENLKELYERKISNMNSRIEDLEETILKMGIGQPDRDSLCLIDTHQEDPPQIKLNNPQALKNFDNGIRSVSPRSTSPYASS